MQGTQTGLEEGRILTPSTLDYLSSIGSPGWHAPTCAQCVPGPLPHFTATVSGQTHGLMKIYSSATAGSSQLGQRIQCTRSVFKANFPEFMVQLYSLTCIYCQGQSSSPWRESHETSTSYLPLGCENEILDDCMDNHEGNVCDSS